ncbi:MAG TPA: hypothetical protein ENG48_11105 [Candidatus Atribacteria bacterium]|nr:hypothetical protein [Candidatus Atribacteria bacterium]
MSIFLPVFSGGVFGNNDMVIAQKNFVFYTMEELEKANKERPFVNFFPFPVIFTRVHEVEDKGFEGVAVKIGNTDLVCIAGDIYDGVD